MSTSSGFQGLTSFFCEIHCQLFSDTVKDFEQIYRANPKNLFANQLTPFSAVTAKKDPVSGCTFKVDKRVVRVLVDPHCSH